VDHQLARQGQLSAAAGLGQFGVFQAVLAAIGCWRLQYWCTVHDVAQNLSLASMVICVWYTISNTHATHAGTKRFGMCYVDESGRLSAIGTTLEIQDFVRESSGRIYVTNKGIERFKVTKVVNERPVLLCEVEVLPEDDNTSEEVSSKQCCPAMSLQHQGVCCNGLPPPPVLLMP
jgi:hypothetical protein